MRKNLLYLLFAVVPFIGLAQSGGCLSAVNGMYPYSVVTPSCAGIMETATTTGWSGEYSKIQVTEGVQYKFSSSISTDLVTIGNEGGTEVLTYGFGSVTFTPEASGVIRFYTHVDANCTDDQEDRYRMILCGEPGPEQVYGCAQTYDAGTFAFSTSIENNHGLKTANDFFVPKTAQNYQLNSVTALIYAMAGSNTDFTTFDVKILSDNDGVPGELIQSYDAVSPASVVLAPEIFFGYKTYYVNIDTDGLELEGSNDEDTRYWVIFSATSFNNMDMFWVAYPYTNGWETRPTLTTIDGNTWIEASQFFTGDKYDSFMEIDASCDMMGVKDLNAFEFNYYPNPVRDILTLDSRKAIEKVEIFNISGQSLGKTFKAEHGKIDMSGLQAGVYVFKVVLEGGQVETFKIVKK